MQEARYSMNKMKKVEHKLVHCIYFCFGLMKKEREEDGVCGMVHLQVTTIIGLSSEPTVSLVVHGSQLDLVSDLGIE
jgi:hypothetical protein